MLNRFTQREEIINILKDTDYTKVNPTGFLLVLRAGGCDFNVVFVNYNMSPILNEVTLNLLFAFLMPDIYSCVPSIEVKPDYR